MKVSIYRHHPCSPLFGLRMTEVYPYVNYRRYALWVFLGPVDVVIKHNGLGVVGFMIDDYRYGVYAYIHESGHSRFKAHLLSARDTLRWVAAVVICRIKGHEWVDESYGGPESGAMAGRCERCGHSFHHQLY